MIVTLTGLLVVLLFAVSGFVLAALAAAVGGPILVLVVWLWMAVGVLSYLVVLWNYPSMSAQQRSLVLADCSRASAGVVSYLMLRWRHRLTAGR